MLFLLFIFNSSVCSWNYLKISHIEIKCRKHGKSLAFPMTLLFRSEGFCLALEPQHRWRRAVL